MLTNVPCRQPPDFAPLVSEPHTSSSAGRPDDEDGGGVGGRTAAAGAVGKRGAATGAPIRLRFRAHHVRRVEYGFPPRFASHTTTFNAKSGTVRKCRIAKSANTAKNSNPMSEHLFSSPPLRQCIKIPNETNDDVSKLDRIRRKIIA